jgi:hypothetical protein
VIVTLRMRSGTSGTITIDQPSLIWTRIQRRAAIRPQAIIWIHPRYISPMTAMMFYPDCRRRPASALTYRAASRGVAAACGCSEMYIRAPLAFSSCPTRSAPITHHACLRHHLRLRRRVRRRLGRAVQGADVLSRQAPCLRRGIAGVLEPLLRAEYVNRDVQYCDVY